MFEDERGTPHQPVSCDRCAVEVLVKKNSLAHTMVQWTSASDTCTQLVPGDATCPFLRDSIESAVRRGRLLVGNDPSAIPISGNLPASDPGPQ